MQVADNALAVTVSPHIHEKSRTIERGMLDVLIALVPVVAVAIVVFGMNVIYIIAVSVITAGLTEVVVRRVLGRRQSLHDLSAMVTGLLFALVLPPTTPLWVVAIGAFIAVAVAKELFGGLGKNVFNPALFARLVLMVTPLAVYVHKYARPFFWKATGFFTPIATSIDNSVVGRAAYKTLTGRVVLNAATGAPNALTGATPLTLIKNGSMLANTVSSSTPVGATWLTTTGRPSLWSTFLGLRSGSIGEISILALLIGGAYLIYRGTIDWRIPAGMIGSFFLLTAVTWNHPVYQLLGGGLVLGAFYMATDWVTSPMTRRGKWIYAVGIGVTIALLRFFSPWPEGVAIAILQWNLITILIDRYVTQPRFGEARRPWFARTRGYAGPSVEVAAVPAGKVLPAGGRS